MIAHKRFAFLTAVAFGILLLPFLFGYHFTKIKDVSLSYIKHASRSRAFHLLLPATGPNLHFCRLLLSAAVTGYPEPIFIGWDGRGMYNGSESHLFKITETLTYLRSLPPSADNDLVLLLDAYDIWLQLRPEVMIERYHSVIKQNDERLRQQGLLGKYHGGDYVRNSIVVGPDKIFWPQGIDDPASWAVPESPLPKDSFGPATDFIMLTARPRWLNSGTIMGPVGDLRDYFAATLDMVSRRYDSNYEFRNSDQLYFAEVWAEQEIQRRRLRDGNFEAPEVLEGVKGIMPEIPKGRRTEYHICLDYRTEMFQTATAFEKHLTWMRFNLTSETYPDIPQDDRFGGGEVADGWVKDIRIDKIKLTDDILETDPPFAAADEPTDMPKNQSWSETNLGTNLVTREAFPLFHVTGDKGIRDRWWPRMWFHPYGEELLKATKKKEHVLSSGTTGKQSGLRKGQFVFAKAAGTNWRGAVPVVTHARPQLEDEKGGAWVDNGDYVPWNAMCGAYEGEDLYIGPELAGKDNPPPPEPEEEEEERTEEQAEEQARR
ncbi:hypothetical protein CBER1_02273 [Cercospora berteroae]|uniref:Uncharacterized protein n=1 Tax=Cercospora berteroae TaxID=357750 RepID=A0A2S6CAX6_9PEZI|nr:hypothetical protein CBER1_02273 [Cercospora berteroae]